jgi:branched-chain amino acid transport system substrate-binding protein
MQAAAVELNLAGGILGHQVKMTNFDDQGNPTQANSLLQQALASGTKWDFAISGGTSDENLAQMPGLNGAKIINVSNASSSLLYDPTKNPYHFGISTQSDLTAKFLVDYVAKQNYKKVGLFTYDGAYGQSEYVSISKWLTAANIPFVGMKFSSAAIDLSPQILQLKDTGVDAVIWSDLGAQIGYTIKSRAKVGWFVPWIGDLGVSSSDTYTLAGDPANLQNMTMQQFSVDIYKPLKDQTPTFQKFWNSLQAVSTRSPQPLHLYVTCYDILKAFALTAKQVNSIDNEKVKAAWEAGWVPPPGELVWASKGWGWTKTSHAPNNTPDEFEVIKIGKLVQGQVQPA